MLRCSRLAAFAAALLISSCGGGGGEPSQPAITPPLDFADSGMAVIKARSTLDGVTILEEKPTPLTETGPQRRVTLLDQAGGVRARYSAPAGSSIIDFAQHPSGEITVALATAKTVTLVRLDRLANPGTPFPLVDAQAPSDPFFILGDGVRDDTSMVPVLTRDAVRLAPVQEDVVVALRTGRNAVVAYRFVFGTPGKVYAAQWRTLVEPGVTMLGVGITSGSYDTFGQLENHFHVHVDADAAGNVAVGVAGKQEVAPILLAHGVFFHETQAIGNAQSGALVTRLTPDGQRIGTTFIDFIGEGELHAIRMHATGIALVGRLNVFQGTDGRGWLAFAANIDRADGAVKFFKTVDVERSDALFDIVKLPGAAFAAGGTAGYTQNPQGASISEQSTPLLVILEADGSLRQRIALPAGPRQNQVRSIAPRGNTWLLASLVNGPGTHSGDANPALIGADGSVREITLPLQ